MENRIAFSTYNPIINFAFYIAAIVFSMIFMHPMYLLASLILSFVFYFSISGKDSFKILGLIIPVSILIIIFNLIFNSNGETVFLIVFGRNITIESLIYGVIFASEFSSMIMWFASYNKLMTSDKFIYVFGPITPSLSLIFNMIMRFVPNYGKKAKQITTARACIGKNNVTGTLSSLTTWAFENGLTTADSMKSRGYGVGKRTNFSIYRFDYQDVLLLVVMIVLVIVVGICAALGGTKVELDPKFTMVDFSNIYCLVGMIAYVILLSIPTILNLKEVLKWQILKSKI